MYVNGQQVDDTSFINLEHRLVLYVCQYMPTAEQIGELSRTVAQASSEGFNFKLVLSLPKDVTSKQIMAFSSTSLWIGYVQYSAAELEKVLKHVDNKPTAESSGLYILEKDTHKPLFQMVSAGSFFMNGESCMQVLKGLPRDSNQNTTVAKKIWYAPHKFEAYGEEEIKAVERCLRNGWLAPGPETAQFEASVAKYFGKKYGLMVNSGSSANICSLMVLDMKPGSKIITAALTFSTTVAPMVQNGYVPVFIDTEHSAYVPTTASVLKAMEENPDCKCIMLPNLIGAKPDWAAIRKGVPSDVVLIEDSCDCMTYTEESDIAVCSFYASHIITAGGCGGVVMFNSEAHLKRALMYRDWGRIGTNSEDVSERFAHNVDGIEYDFKFLYGVRGYNFKCSEMNAAFGNAQMAKLPIFIQMRRDNIARYCENLSKYKTGYILPKGATTFDWLAMPLMHRNRKQILPWLEKKDVQVRVCFAGNITRHPAYREFLKPYAEADRCMAEGFLLGAHHGLTPADIDYVCELLVEADRLFPVAK